MDRDWVSEPNTFVIKSEKKDAKAWLGRATIYKNSNKEKETFIIEGLINKAIFIKRLFGRANLPSESFVLSEISLKLVNYSSLTPLWELQNDRKSESCNYTSDTRVIVTIVSDIL